MRLVFIVFLLAGIGLGIGYPWAILHFSGEEIGSWRIHERGGPYKAVTIALRAEDAPIRAFVDMQTLGNFTPTVARTALTAVVTRNGRDVLVETLSYAGSKVTNRGSPQGPRVYRDSIGDIDGVESGAYVFTIGPGDIDGLQVARVDLVLRKGAKNFDRRVVAAGIALLATGLFGLVFLRRRRKAAARAAPQPPRWGRS
ncbi:MAG: hypothetical protein ACRECY_15345 [Phyllobacterium sp.]